MPWIKYTNKAQMVEDLEQECYLKEKGHVTVIEVYPGGTQDGLEYGPVLVEVVVLDTDGHTIACRTSTDAQDEDWQIGCIEDAVEEALAYHEQAEDTKQDLTEEQIRLEEWAQENLR